MKLYRYLRRLWLRAFPFRNSLGYKVIKHRPQCHCGGSSYSETFDSYYCPNCLVWLEKACSCTTGCHFTGRPESPRNLSDA